MNSIIALLIVLPLAYIFYYFLFRSGEKIGENKLEFIKNQKLRSFVGIMIVWGIIVGFINIIFALN
jgi:hypothetical protein